MSTFAANVNAGPAYLVNDIYRRFINPGAPQDKLVRLSYFASAIMVIAGITTGFFVSSINNLLQWITAALFGGYAAANFLTWIWWRFNGHGYFWGMIAGLVASLLVPRLFPDLSVIVAFPLLILPFSAAGSLAGCLLTPPDDMEVLKSFYRSVRPWGFWHPVYLEVVHEDPDFAPNRAFKRDMFNSLVGVVWQMMLILLPVYLVIKEYRSMIVTLVLLVVTSIILKFSWYNKLER